MNENNELFLRILTFKGIIFAVSCEQENRFRKTIHPLDSQEVVHSSGSIMRLTTWFSAVLCGVLVRGLSHSLDGEDDDSGNRILIELSDFYDQDDANFTVYQDIVNSLNETRQPDPPPHDQHARIARYVTHLSGKKRK
jgi:hypothetical protein